MTFDQPVSDPTEAVYNAGTFGRFGVKSFRGRWTIQLRHRMG